MVEGIKDKNIFHNLFLQKEFVFQVSVLRRTGLVALEYMSCAIHTSFSLVSMYLTKCLVGVHAKPTCLVAILHSMSWTLQHTFAPYLAH